MNQTHQDRWIVKRVIGFFEKNVDSVSDFQARQTDIEASFP